MDGPAVEEETILHAEDAKSQRSGPKRQLDIAGHYARPDVFELRVCRSPQPIITVVENQSPESIDEST